MSAITAYLQFYEKHPDYFKQDDDLYVVTSEEALRQYAAQHACQLGLIYETKYFWIVIDLLQNVAEERYPYMRMIHKERSNGVVIIPQYEGKIVFLNQFRHGSRQLELELPRGFAEKGLTVYENAAQEIAEEIGAKAENLQLLGKIMSDSGLTSSPVSILLCDISSIGQLEHDEGIKDVTLLSKDEVLEAIASDQIRDSFSICAMMKWTLHTERSK